jgi:hypothetical protein
MRVGVNPRIGVRSRGRPRRAGVTAVRMGTLNATLTSSAHSLCLFSRIVGDAVAPSKNQWEGRIMYSPLGKQWDNSNKIILKNHVRVLYTPPSAPLRFP